MRPVNEQPKSGAGDSQRSGRNGFWCSRMAALCRRLKTLRMRLDAELKARLYLQRPQNFLNKLAKWVGQLPLAISAATRAKSSVRMRSTEMAGDTARIAA